MKKILVPLSLVVLGVAAFAAPVRSMLGSDGAEIMDAEMPTAADYIQDGLVCMFDGIENVEWGVHDSGATTWTDIVGGCTTTWLSDANNGLAWENGGLRRIGMKGITATVPWLANITTNTKYSIEVVLSDDSEIDTMSIGTYFYFGHGVDYRIGAIRDRSPLICYTGSTYYSFSQIPNYQFSMHTLSCRALGKGYRILSNGAAVQNGELFADGSKLSSGRISVNSSTTLGFFRVSRDWPDTRDTTIYSVRIYSRDLTDEEFIYNHMIDKMRFGL